MKTISNSKRSALQDALVAKLVYKYAKRDDEFGRIIVSLVSKLVRTTAKLVEADISALEKTVKKLHDERGRKQRRDDERVGFQAPPPEDALDVKVAEWGPRLSSPRVQPAVKAETINLKTQDEWVLINALNSVEFEDSEKHNIETKHIKTVQQRQWLDSQKKEKDKKFKSLLEEKHDMYEHQGTDDDMRQHNGGQAKDAVDHIRMERDRQLRESKELHAKLEEKRRQEEELEVQRCKDELKRTEMEALERKRVQHARMQSLLKENIQVQREKEKKKSLDQERDVKLMEEYAQKLAKEEAERVAALQHKLTRQDRIQNGIALSIHEQLKLKEMEDEQRADDYQRHKLESDREKEQEEALDRKKYLTFQHEVKEEKKKKLNKEEVEYSNKYREEGELALREMKQKQDNARVRNKEYQKLLLSQMQEQKVRKAATFKSMDPREKSLNAILLRKLDVDEDLSQKVVAKLSPDKMVRAKPRNNIF
ncbi:hypothetical protein DYB25_001053 [Aphanomyces astaci]|uniref:Trichohyalin-plectin-homology domain-containing protein n=1 Tax=Aphanomyces astaci TaxID=112090 RepID=A0A397D9J5_APHAT|nr:hypothetical protein DYB25_001053 [Aphanomyces astaci]RHY44373.1 hypothetical protein DYB34_000442 [Aphanomyces astaci]RHY51497.1 hypothetical protein DYB30_002243 [Aphanomyces astaci]RHY61270.1 hypothetical protein DYB38_000269 [Aphanomyces astaci]RHZ13057.1 hypothetical protein DYB26_004929 [Aphanomyces astaci]